MNKEKTELVLPEDIRLPEVHRVAAFRGVGDLVLRLARGAQGMPYKVRAGEGYVSRDIVLNRQNTGELVAAYDYKKRLIEIENIFVSPNNRGKGIASAVIQELLDIPLPSGEDPRIHGFHIYAEHLTVDGVRLAERLTQKGGGRKLGREKYISR